MILTLESESAYLILTKYRSRSTAWYIFGQDPSTVKKTMTNAPLHAIWNTIKNVMASSAESEAREIFMGGKHCRPMRITAIKLGYPQPSNGTLFYSDKKTAKGILKSIVRQKLSKYFDMNFYCMQDEISQKKIWTNLDKQRPQQGRLLHQASYAVASQSDAIQIHV